MDDELLTVNNIKGASAEYITLTNPDLNIYEDDSSAMTDERVQHKITGFRCDCLFSLFNMMTTISSISHSYLSCDLSWI